MRRSIGWLGISALSLSLVSTASLGASPKAHHARKTAAKPAAEQSAKDKSVAIKSVPDLGAMLAFVDKLFPPQPDPDPARLALARTAAGSMWADGAYGKMMTGMFGGMFDRAMAMKQSDFAALGGKAPKVGTAASGTDASIHDKAVAKDPHFDQRIAAIRAAIDDEMVKVSAIIDPRVREGLARSMARRFEARQLTDIDAFFATPSGHALATQYMQLWFDPDMMRSLFGSVPEMMKLMPEMAQKIKEAEEKFPKPPPSSPVPGSKPDKL